MLSDNERRRLNELEAQLRADDPALAGAFDVRGRFVPRRRRAVAIGLAAVAGTGALVGLLTGSVVTVVIALCLLGVAAGVWTWQPKAMHRNT